MPRSNTWVKCVCGRVRPARIRIGVGEMASIVRVVNWWCCCQSEQFIVRDLKFGTMGVIDGELGYCSTMPTSN